MEPPMPKTVVLRVVEVALVRKVVVRLVPAVTLREAACNPAENVEVELAPVTFRKPYTVEVAVVPETKLAVF